MGEKGKDSNIDWDMGNKTSYEKWEVQVINKLILCELQTVTYSFTEYFPLISHTAYSIQSKILNG